MSLIFSLFFPFPLPLPFSLLPSPSPSPFQIRASVYGVVPVLCVKVPGYVQGKCKLCCSTVLSSLGESDPMVVGPLWEAVIMVIAKTEVRGGCGWRCGLGRVTRWWSEEVAILLRQKGVICGYRRGCFFMPLPPCTLTPVVHYSRTGVTT